MAQDQQTRKCCSRMVIRWKNSLQLLTYGRAILPELTNISTGLYHIINILYINILIMVTLSLIHISLVFTGWKVGVGNA